MARRTAPSVDEEAIALADWERRYRERISRPAVEDVHHWPPVTVGPTWQHDGRGWLLPKQTLGWTMLAWCSFYLTDEMGRPWIFTDEQARFLLHWYAVDEAGRFLYSSGVLQRLKGWGKDPVGAAISLFELSGPCRVARMEAGQPVGERHPQPWVQIAAVSLEQTKTTMMLLPSMVGPPLRRAGVSPAKETVYQGAGRFLQALTSSPATLQGARSTFVLMNETHEWVSGNSGHDMAYVISNNATKSSDGAARTLRITNAYEPGEDSVAERDREAYEKVLSGEAMPFGLLYDSLEAAPDAPLAADAAQEVVESVRGDSVWLDSSRIVQSIIDTRNPASQSRRFWYNQVTAAEDAWADPRDVDLAVVDDELQPGDTVVIFGDGSKSDDATGLLAVRLSDGLAQVLHVQQPKKGQIVDREAVDRAVEEAFGTYKVVAFWFDPSHTKDRDAEEDARFWWPYCDRWHKSYGKRLKLWARSGVANRHAVAWDMALDVNQAVFVPAVQQCLTDLEHREVRFHRSDWLRQHCKNARRNPNTKWGITIRKEHRESARKIDLAVCLVGARMLRRAYLLQDKTAGRRAPGRGRVVVLED